MKKLALVSAIAALAFSTAAEARWGRPWRAGGIFVGPLHVGYYSYGVYAPPPPMPVYYAAPVAYYVPPPVYYIAPAPVYVAPPPVAAPAPVYYAPATPPAPPPVIAAPAPVIVEDNHIPRLAVKWAPLGVTSLQAPPDVTGKSGGFPLNAGSVGIEYRFPNRYWALRSDFEYGLYGGAWDFVSLKLSLFPRSFLRPFVSAGVTGSNVYDHNIVTGVVTETPSLGGVAAAGLDVFFGKHFFLEAEVKGRAFVFGVGNQTTTPPGATPAPYTATTQFSGMLGAGVAFF